MYNINSIAEKANDLAKEISLEEAAFFIAVFEKAYADWELTEKLIRHYKALEQEYKQGFKPHERADLSPQKII